jgi:hypothetical protein
VSLLNAKLGPKRLELMHEMVPTATIVTVLRQPDQSQFRDPIERPAGGGPRGAAFGVRLNAFAPGPPTSRCSTGSTGSGGAVRARSVWACRQPNVVTRKAALRKPKTADRERESADTRSR